MLFVDGNRHEMKFIYLYAGKSMRHHIISNPNTACVKDTDPSVLQGFKRLRPGHVSKWL